MSTILIAFVALLGIALIAVGVYVAFFSPSAARYRAIRKQAQLDYRNARGTVHLQLLRQAHRRLKVAYKECNTQLQDAQQRLAQLEKDKNGSLRMALERHIAYTYLDQVPGIGSGLKERILSEVFRGHLTDLKWAYDVRGVGQERQWAINQWLKETERRIPSLLQETFPKKDEILGSYSREKRELDAMIAELTARRAKLLAQNKQVIAAATPLQGVRAKDFQRALRNAGKPSDRIDIYLQGVFAEWEPVPDWFREVVSQEYD